MERLLDLILYATVNINQQYSQKAMMLLNKMGINGFIIVSRFDSEVLPRCGLACSIGLGGFGIVFMHRGLLTDPNIPEELKDFILAHEVAHITRSHVLPRFITRFLAESTIKALSENLKYPTKTGSLSDLFNILAEILFAAVILKTTIEADSQIIRQQELEADNIAIDLVGCEGALTFTKILEYLRSQGYSVSHESILGTPALSINERIRFIYQRCGS